MTRVLVVEDNRNLATGLRNNLEIEGYEVDVAGDGAAGLALARSTSPDLIILDLMLPGMDGYRVLKTLREEGIDTPVLILSARGDFGYGPGQRIAHMNHVEGGVATAFGYIGITDVASVAIEYDEFADDRLRASITSAESEVDALVACMASAVEAA